MKALRILLTVLVVALLLALILAGLAFVPSVQTWAAQRALNRRPGLRASIGSLSADLGSIEVSDLHLKADGADLQIPSLTADLPVIPAVWRRRAAVRRLVAKGWTLDLRTAPEAETAGDAAAFAEATASQAAIFHGILDRLLLPCDLALDGAELEGEVFLPGAKPKSSIRVHVVLHGGGLAGGKEGGFDFEASSSTLDAERQLVELTARGRLALAMATPRTFGRVGLSSILSAQGGPFPAGIQLKAEASAARDAGGETYTLALDRGARRAAEFTAALTGGGSRLAGTWKLDGSDTDIAPFLPDRPLPAFHAAGAGRFDCDAGFGRVHAQGDLTATLSRLEVLTPALEGAGIVRLAAGFDASHDGHSLQVDRLDATATGPGPTATIRALHPFAIDEHTGDLQGQTSDAADWLNVSVRNFPLALITGLPGGLTIAGGAAAGDFTIRRESGGFVLRSRSPFSAAGVSLRRAGELIARRLDLSASLAAQRKSDAWEIQASPLRLASAGRPLGELTFRLSRPDGADQPFALTGTWKADLAAIAAQAVFPDLGWLAGRSAAGEFSTAGGASPAWDGKLTATGMDPRNSIAAAFHTELGQQGTLSFTIPLKITQASGASEFSLEGMWSEDESGRRLTLQLNGQDVREEDVQALALPLIGSEMTAGAASGGTPDRAPFWGGWVGSLRIAFDKLSAGGKSYADVGASFEIGADSIHLQGGHVELDHPRGARAEGELTFSPSRPHPYQVRAKVAIDPFKAGPYFPPADADSYASIEGKVAIDASLAGQGDNLPDLVRHTAETFQLTSTDSIVRFLKTDVHEAIPHNESSRFSDGLSTAGSTIGSFFGGHRDGSTAAKNPVSPTAEAMIDFTQEAAEIGFDRAAVTAVREGDGSFRLTAIDLAGEREHIVGTGVIAAAPGIPLLDRPLSLDLVFWAHGRAARLLAKASLLSAEKDSHGFSRLNQIIHLGGTLGQVDVRAWHRLLVKAAAQNPAGAKKKGD